MPKFHSHSKVRESSSAQNGASRLDLGFLREDSLGVESPAVAGLSLVGYGTTITGGRRVSSSAFFIFI